MKKFLLLLAAVLMALSFSTMATSATITQYASGTGQPDYSDDYWDFYGLNLVQSYNSNSWTWFVYSPPAPVTGISWNDGTQTAGFWWTQDLSFDYFSLQAGDETNGGGFLLYKIDDYVYEESVSWSTADLNYNPMDIIAWWRTSDSMPPVPEPTTIFLLGFGLLGIAGISRRKRIS